MIGKEEARALLKEALSQSMADQTEILLIHGKSALSRFANSAIHQSTNRVDDYLQVRAVVDNKIGVATTNQFDNLKDTVNKAYEAAKMASPSKDFVTLPKDGSIEVDEFRFSQKTANFGPIERAAYIEQVIKKAGKYTAAGIFETSDSTMAIANSNGVFSYQRQTDAQLNTIFYSDNESSFAYDASFDVDKIDAQALGERALEIVLKSQETVSLDPGKYTVILAPAAVAEMLGLLAFAGLGALSLQENRSFMNNKIGKQIANTQINLFDDASDERSMGALFDYEGVKRQKVDFIKEGIAKDVVYDSFTAQISGHPNTGHALPATSKYGPLPLNMILEPGVEKVDDLIASTSKGLYINRFHYTNLENPLEAVFTGMTRDGTFLIENGKITKAVKNMRLTQSILKALQDVEAIASDGTLAEGLTGYSFVPSLKINNFNFSSV